MRFDGDRLPEVQQFGDIARKLHERLANNAGYLAAIQPEVASPLSSWQKMHDELNAIVPANLSGKGCSSRLPNSLV